MHVSRDELEATVIGAYEGRQVDAATMRIAFEPVEMIELSPVEEHDRTMATLAKNMGLTVS